MGDFLTFVIHDSLLLFAVVNPLGSIPVYVDLTSRFEPARRRSIMNIAVATSLGMVVVFTFVGNWCLVHLFGITLMEFRIAGGILLFIVALQGVMPRGSGYSANRLDEGMLAIFPLAFPIMVGPGALTITMIMAQKSGSVQMMATSVVTFAMVLVIARNSHILMKVLGPYAGKVVSRLLYIFLAAKAVSMVLEGIGEFVGQLKISAGG